MNFLSSAGFYLCTHHFLLFLSFINFPDLFYMDLTRRIRDKMMKERLMFVYRGVVTNENSVALLVLLEKEIENSEFGFLGRKRLFMFVLESLQNVTRHSTKNKHAGMSMVVYSKADNGYTVTTGNVLQTTAVEELKSRLKEINCLEPEEIRSVYRKMLSSAEFSNKGGAGLGLIEMAKKTGNKLDYDFVPLKDDLSYFILSKTIDSGGVGLHFKRDEQSFHGKAVSQLERIMADNNVYLLWLGHISPDVGKEVLSFNETKLSEEDINSMMRKRVFSILVEILENVLKYSPGKEAEEKYGMPVIMIRMFDKAFYLTTGNLILNSDVGALRQKLDLINNYDKTELKDLFIKSLSSQDLKSDSTGNMGLIDMARKSGSKLEYKFEELNDPYSYYTLTVKVDQKIN